MAIIETNGYAKRVAPHFWQNVVGFHCIPAIDICVVVSFPNSMILAVMHDIVLDETH